MDEKILTFYVAIDGKDTWSGLYPEPNAEGTDGPLATIEAARDKIRNLKSNGTISGKTKVIIRGGRYQISRPIIFTPEDSHTAYENFPGEIPVIDCGIKIKNWSKTRVNGVDAFFSDIKKETEQNFYFYQLFVNGKRKKRPILPEKGFYRIKITEEEKKKSLFEGSDRFFINNQDMKKWKNLQDIELVILHRWIEERVLIKDFEQEKGLVILSKKTKMNLADEKGEGSRYLVENIFEELKKPGQWYLDRTGGLLFYIPEENEDINSIEAYASMLAQAFIFEGSPETGKYIENITIKGLLIEHGERIASDDEKNLSVQAAYSIPGVIYLKGCTNCSIKHCEIRHSGCYGIEISDGCKDINITGNHIHDMGAGGIKINGGDAVSEVCKRTSFINVIGNHIHDCGILYHSAAGILSMHASDCKFSDNHIHDLYYTGISCGWVWGYGENVSKNNIVENNFIHDIGKGLLSDMGGIYTLGVQPATVIRKNFIYRIEKYGYGAWCIYLDEGSSHIVVEDNICAFTNSQIFHQHYGRENIIRNNIFAFGDEGVISLSRGEDHNSFTFERNILIGEEKPFFIFSYGVKKLSGLISELNLFWEKSGKEPLWGYFNTTGQRISFEEAKKSGYDKHSIFADPYFLNPENLDFRLKSVENVEKIGFKHFTLKDEKNGKGFATGIEESR